MSVLLPWQRDTKNVRRYHSGKEARQSPAPPPARASVVRKAIIATMLLAITYILGKALYEHFVSNAIRTADTVWEVPAIEAQCGTYVIARDAASLALYGPSGKMADLPQHEGRPVVSNGKAYFADGAVLKAAGTSGTAAIAEVQPNPVLLPCPGFDGVLLAYPESCGAFGERWLVKAVSADGTVLSEVPLPGLPAVAAASGPRMAIGLRDVSAGGASSLACLNLSTGSPSWVRSVGKGHWRGIVVTPAGTVAYATSLEAGLFDSHGARTFECGGEGSFGACAYEAGVFIVSCETPGGGANLSAYGEDKALLWRRPIPSNAHTLSTEGTTVVALCQNHVIGFSRKEGAKEFSLTTPNQPLAFGDGALLLGKASGVSLLRLDTDRAR